MIKQEQIHRGLVVNVLRDVGKSMQVLVEPGLVLFPNIGGCGSVIRKVTKAIASDKPEDVDQRDLGELIYYIADMLER